MKPPPLPSQPPPLSSDKLRSFNPGHLRVVAANADNLLGGSLESRHGSESSAKNVHGDQLRKFTTKSVFAMRRLYTERLFSAPFGALLAWPDQLPCGLSGLG